MRVNIPVLVWPDGRLLAIRDTEIPSIMDYHCPYTDAYDAHELQLEIDIPETLFKEKHKVTGKPSKTTHPYEKLPDVLTVKETYEFLRIGRATAYEMISRGEIPVKRLGKKILVPRDNLLKWLEDSNETSE